jgi:lipopolysaccharide transport system permease protein
MSKPRKLGPLEMLRGSLRYRELVSMLIRREVMGRYRGSLLGLAWSFFHPLLMLSVFTVFFSVIFKARWGAGGSSTAEFAANVFVGLILHGFLAECVNRAPSVIIANVNFVKKVLFPLETLPIVVLGAALFHLAISFIVLLLMLPFLGMQLHWTAALLPLVVLPLALIVLGVSWVLAALGVFARDVAQVTAVLSSVLLFASPVFFPTSALPDRLQLLLRLNPLTYPIEQARAMVLDGSAVDARALAVYWTVALVIAWLGFAFFQRSRDGFADVV